MLELVPITLKEATRKGRRGRHKGNTAACRHGGQFKAVPDTTGSIRQIFTDYGVL